MVQSIVISEGLVQFPSPSITPVQEGLMPFSGFYRHCDAQTEKEEAI